LGCECREEKPKRLLPAVIVWPELEIAPQSHERAQFLWRGLGLEKRFDAIHYSADLVWGEASGGVFRRDRAPEQVFASADILH
jgi:hypothetical protein